MILPRSLTGVGALLLLLTLVPLPSSAAAEAGYENRSDACSLQRSALEVTSPWPCSVSQVGSVRLDSCTATHCTVIATGSAHGIGELPEPLHAGAQPMVRAMIALKREVPGRTICSGTGSAATGASCSGSTSFTFPRDDLFCVFAEYTFGLQHVVTSQGVWHTSGTDSIDVIHGSGC